MAAASSVRHVVVNPVGRPKDLQEATFLKRPCQFRVSGSVPAIHVAWEEDRDIVEEKKQGLHPTLFEIRPVGSRKVVSRVVHVGSALV